MQQNPQYKEDLKIALDELRARYARCNNKYDQLQTKFFALLAGQLTVAALLLAPFFTGENMKLPDETYGLIIFLVGVALLVGAIGLSFMSASSNEWAEAPERRRILGNEEIKAHSDVDFLERIKEDYDTAIEFCESKFDKRASRLDWSIRMFVLAVIILLVLKFGGAS